jgi:putative Ca2+/H+ antiporter (TMEM165/GDT1 family)
MPDVEGPLPFLAALGLIAILELGDKTQLATISLAARHPWRPVFAGASLGLIAATSIGVAAGALLAVGLEAQLKWVKVGGGLLFVALGLWGYFRPEEDEADGGSNSRSAFAQSFLLNFLAEMGDKTQIAVLVLAATEAAPISVFAGASAALVFVAATSVFIGAQLARRMTEKTVRTLSAALFVVAGVLLIGEALLAG